MFLLLHVVCTWRKTSDMRKTSWQQFTRMADQDVLCTCVFVFILPAMRAAQKESISHGRAPANTYCVYMCLCLCLREDIYTVVHKVGWPPLAMGGSCLIVHLHRVASSWRGLFCYLRRAELVTIKFDRDQNQLQISMTIVILCSVTPFPRPLAS